MIRSQRYLAASATLLLLATTVMTGLAPRQQPQIPKIPEGVGPDNMPVVGPRVPYDPDRAAARLAFYQEKAKVDPEGAIAYRELAGAYLAHGRETGDIGETVEAEAAARKSLAILPRGNANALQRLARALLGQHRFPEALQAADRAAAIEPGAQRLRADILLELGEVDAARAAIAKVPPMADDLNLLALRARIAEQDGRPDESLRLLREGARLTDDLSDMPHESVAWYQTMIGHHLIDAGKLGPGEKACLKALEIFPRDYRALTGLAEAATWRGDHEASIRRCREALAIAPQNPEALRLLGESLAAQGKAKEAQAEFDRLRTLAGSFPRIYDRHWILFCADHGVDPDATVALARKDLELRHDVHAFDTLAWACLKAGKLDEADAMSRKALAGGVRDATLYHHAAEVARARGESARADELLKAAKALNPYLVK